MAALSRGLVALVLAASAARAGAAAPGLQPLAWLAGCWQSAAGEPGSGEQWTPLAGGTMLGIGRTVKRGRTVAFEFMQIRSAEGGTIEFVAQPSGKPPTVFVLKQLGDDGMATFENLQHDFPHRVIYARGGPQELRARIEGLRNGEQRVVEFPMRRVRCEADGEAAR